MKAYAVELLLSIRANPYRGARDYEAKLIWMIDMERALRAMGRKRRTLLLLTAGGWMKKDIAALLGMPAWKVSRL